MLRIWPVIAISAGLALPLGAQQQDTSAPAQQKPPAQQNSGAQQQNPPAGSSAGQQKPAPKKPSASAQNPFPEAQSEAAAHQAQQAGDGTAASQDSAGQDSAGQGSAGQGSGKASDANPFPETQSEKAAKQDGQAAAAAGDKPDPNSSSSNLGLKLQDVPGDKAGDGAAVNSPEAAVKDTQVGTFYLKTGDYKGAYARFAEAARVDPGNADAVFGLAESSRRLNRRDEAIRNYQVYLAALPDGPHAKEARKALKEMGVSGGS